MLHLSVRSGGEVCTSPCSGTEIRPPEIIHANLLSSCSPFYNLVTCAI